MVGRVRGDLAGSSALAWPHTWGVVSLLGWVGPKRTMDSAVMAQIMRAGWDVCGCNSRLYHFLADDFEPLVCFLIREMRVTTLYGQWCRISDEHMLRGNSSFPLYKNEGKVVVLQEGGLSWDHKVLIRLCYLGKAGGAHGGCGRSHPGWPWCGHCVKCSKWSLVDSDLVFKNSLFHCNMYMNRSSFFTFDIINKLDILHNLPFSVTA